ncbi:MAG: hypothetical protein AAB768_01890 [Patescibacteria group bacterium]|mgnify:FL=1
MSKNITKFYFDKAKYLVGDALGNEFFLEVDYKNGKFKLSGKLPNPQKTNIETFALDLIKRKHGINFSDKINL